MNPREGEVGKESDVHSDEGDDGTLVVAAGATRIEMMRRNLASVVIIALIALVASLFGRAR